MGVVSLAPNSEPNGITTGPDGAIWFVEEGVSVSNIGRITTSGEIKEYPFRHLTAGQFGSQTGRTARYSLRSTRLTTSDG